MLCGHIAVGLATKPPAPNMRLGPTLVAGTAIDTLCGLFVLLGIEGANAAGNSVIPWSHGLLMSEVWSGVGFGVTFLATRDRRSSLVPALLVWSHWVPDFVSHPTGPGENLPIDLPPQFEGLPKAGLGLDSVTKLVRRMRYLLCG